MRDCKLWLGMPHICDNKPRTASSQILQEIIRKEIRGAQSTAVLNRRYSIMRDSLRIMLEREELKCGPYCRLTVFLRGEYETRWGVLHEKEV